MGIYFGPHTGNRSATYSAELAAELTKYGGRSSTGAAGLLTYMGGQTRLDSWDMCPEEAEQAARSIEQAARSIEQAARSIEQAARSIEQAAKKLHPGDRRVAEQIAADAWEAANSGRPWIVS
ncbi:hypothetical protein AB0K21_42305 [Streptosporangium sp. NPDC049248]|uniref:hypothetical protein n=1 Tax=Streptosporangium sp. NPDC049248 TaxID=3155651 RepID=UPI003448C02F